MDHMTFPYLKADTRKVSVLGDLKYKINFWNLMISAIYDYYDIIFASILAIVLTFSI